MSRIAGETEVPSQPPSEDDFQTIWNRMQERATEVLDNDFVMAIALEAQRAVRKSKE